MENQDVITSQVKTGSDVIASHSKVCSMKSCCYTKRQGEGGERGEDYGRKIYVETWCLVELTGDFHRGLVGLINSVCLCWRTINNIF